MGGTSLRSGIHLRNGGLLLGAAVLLGGCAYDYRTMMEARAAAAGPAMPLLPMSAKQRITFSGGIGTEAKDTRTDRLTDSSLTPLSMAPRLVAASAQWQFRYRAAYWGGEVSWAKHASDIKTLQLMGMGGFNLAKPSWSVLAWGGIGLASGEGSYTTLEQTRTTTDNRGDESIPVQTIVTSKRTTHWAPNELLLMASGGVAVSLLDDQALAPYAAGRLILNQYLGVEDGVVIENPVYFHRILMDVGARYRVGKILSLRGGVGTVSYLDREFHGLDYTAHVGLSLDALSPPSWWARGTRTPEPAEVDEMVRRYEARQAPRESNEAP